MEGLAIDFKAWEIGVRLVLTRENCRFVVVGLWGLQGKGRVWDCFAAKNFVSQLLSSDKYFSVPMGLLSPRQSLWAKTSNHNRPSP